MKFGYKGDPEQWRAAARAIQGTMAGATRAAFQDLAKQVQTGGRAEIARAGLSRRWQLGFKTSVVPARPVPGSLDVSMRGRHSVGFINVFERGALIAGKPLLWLPLQTAPAKLGGKRLTPRLYQQQIGRLQYVKRPGRPPLLLGKALRVIAPGRRATVSMLRNGTKNDAARRSGGRGRRTVSVPLFIGLTAVHIRDRMNVSGVYDQGRRDLPGLYTKRLAEVTR